MTSLCLHHDRSSAPLGAYDSAGSEATDAAGTAEQAKRLLTVCQRQLVARRTILADITQISPGTSPS